MRLNRIEILKTTCMETEWRKVTWKEQGLVEGVQTWWSHFANKDLPFSFNLMLVHIHEVVMKDIHFPVSRVLVVLVSVVPTYIHEPTNTHMHTYTHTLHNSGLAWTVISRSLSFPIVVVAASCLSICYAVGQWQLLRLLAKRMEANISNEWMSGWLVGWLASECH